MGSEMCIRDRVYPYEYFDCWEKFHEINLPEKEKFFSQLTDSHISDKDYQNALNVFNSLKMQSLQEYHDFYLVCDVLLLADVFEFSTYRAPYLLGCK